MPLTRAGVQIPHSTPLDAEFAPNRNENWLRLAIFAMLLCGFIARLAPLLDRDGRLLRQFPTEDGYLMQTIARNIAIGLGMSTAEGTIPTNGTQPLFTFVSAGCHFLAGGDKIGGIFYVLIVSVAISFAAAFALWRLGRFVFAGMENASAFAALSAAVWFAAANSVRHSMNCLETGAYVLLVIVAVHMYVASSREHARWSLTRCIGIGSLLGMAFWLRNDAVLLIAAACVTRLAAWADGHSKPFRRRVVEAFVMGATTIVVALPWLINNHLRFGNVVPISGQAEALGAKFAGNAHVVPPALAEYIFGVIQIPKSLEGRTVVVAATATLALATVAVLFWLWRRSNTTIRTLILLTGIYGAGLCGFYGLYFGAEYFMSRYLFPLSPFLALLWVAALVGIMRAAGRQWAPRLGFATVAVALALTGWLNYRIYASGPNHMHFQVVDWVYENVPRDVWVGAVQTGTLGYFHDRTINFDGKVNPHALAAQRDGRVLEYVVDSPIEYLADWVGITDWAKGPVLTPHFLVAHEDKNKNLGVLRRTNSVTRSLRTDSAR